MHGHRIFQHGFGQLVDALRHGRAVEQGLPVGIAVLCDAVDVTEESHVQHAVCFIKDEHVDFGQVHIPEVHVAEHPARRHNGNVHSSGQCFFLPVKVAATASSINGHA